VTAMDGVKVMDVAMATAMDSLLAMLRQWMGNGDKCCDSNGNGNRWLIGNTTAMNGLLAAQQ
jgi:hypothetical protein